LFKAFICDFDGVILESVDIKTQAFRSLFKKFPKHIGEIIRYHLKNSGVNRTKKFDYIYKHILHMPLTKMEKHRLEKTFSRLVFRKILKCPFVQGTPNFLEEFTKTKLIFVISATPERELNRIISRRKLRHYFKAVFGAPQSKVSAIRQILKRYRLKPTQTIYIGDARADWLAARATKVQFLGRWADSKNRPFPKSVSCVTNMTEVSNLLATQYRCNATNSDD